MSRPFLLSALLLSLASMVHAEEKGDNNKNLADISKAFLSQVRNDKEADADRIAAAKNLIDFRKADPKAGQELLNLLSPRMSVELSRGLIDALSRSDAPAVGLALLEKMPALTPGLRPTAIRVLLTRADWTGAFLDAVAKGELSLHDLSLDQKQSLLAHPTKALALRVKTMFAKGDGLPNADRQLVIDEIMPLMKFAGDKDKGKLVFKAQCAKCHTHSGEGAKIGPDLTGMSVHSKAHFLIEILDPSRSVEGNFRQYLVATKSGRFLTGLLASESKTAIEIFDSEANKVSVQRDDIDEIQATTKSFMPDGFEKQLSKDDWINLLEFLTHRGHLKSGK